MTIEYITDKFKVWKDGDGYAVTATKKRTKVFKGTKEETEDFISKHPYGMTLAEAERSAVI